MRTITSEQQKAFADAARQQKLERRRHLSRRSDGAVDRRRQLIISLIVVVAVGFAGVAGFYVLGDDMDLFGAVAVTAKVLSTVGDVKRDLNMPQQVWEIILMACGIISVLYAGGNLVAFLIGGEMRRLLGRQQLQKRIQQVKDHYIVCGFGRMGRALCDALAEKGAPFVLIEHDADLTAEADGLGYLYAHGDAMSEELLESVGIGRARGLAACLTSDSDNVFVTLTARGLNDKLTIIARSENIETERKLLRAGANRVICTPRLGANRIMTMMLHPAVDELMDLAVSGPDLEISKVSLDELPRAAGQSLADLALPAKTGMMIVALIRSDGSRQFNPTRNVRLESGDEMIVIGPTGGMERMIAELGGEVG